MPTAHQAINMLDFEEPDPEAGPSNRPIQAQPAAATPPLHPTCSPGSSHTAGGPSTAARSINPVFRAFLQAGIRPRSAPPPLSSPSPSSPTSRRGPAGRAKLLSVVARGNATRPPRTKRLEAAKKCTLFALLQGSPPPLALKAWCTPALNTLKCGGRGAGEEEKTITLTVDTPVASPSVHYPSVYIIEYLLDCNHCIYVFIKLCKLYFI